MKKPPPQLPNKALLTAKEVAKYWGKSPATIYGWVSIGAMKSIKLGGTLRIKFEDAEKGPRFDDFPEE